VSLGECFGRFVRSFCFLRCQAVMKNELDCCPIKMKVVQSFVTSGITHSTTQCHFPQELTFRHSGYWVPFPGFIFAVPHKERTVRMAGFCENCDEPSGFMILTEGLLDGPQGLHCAWYFTVRSTYSNLNWITTGSFPIHSNSVFILLPACVHREGCAIHQQCTTSPAQSVHLYERHLLPALLHKPQTNK
jgi:hypothetical protein